jgi:gliding motility-associated-like protein
MMKNATLSTILLPAYCRIKAKNLLPLLFTLCVTAVITLGMAGGATAQTITSFAPASGPAGTLIKLKGTGLTGATELIIGSKQAIIVANTGTEVTGMLMPVNVSGSVKIRLANGSLVIAKGMYTVTETPYPMVRQSVQLADTTTYNGFYRPNPNDPGSSYVKRRSYGAGQGTSVAVSADGNTALVSIGIGFESFSMSDKGGLIFYERSNGVWVKAPPVQKLFVGAGAIGGLVLLSADGKTAIGDANTSSLHTPGVYRKANGVWTLESSNNNIPSCGVIAMSADANTVVSSTFHPGSGRSGAGFYSRLLMYRYNGSGWVQNGYFDTPDFIYGGAVAISADGKTIVHTAPDRSCIYNKQDTGWVKGPALATGGYKAAISADGKTVLLTGNHPAVVYTLTGKIWSQTQTLPESSIGTLSADGRTIILAGKSPVVYYRSGTGSWVAKSTSLGSFPNGDNTAYGLPSIALSPDGATAVMGIPADTSVTPKLADGNPLGTAYAFGATSPAIVSISPASGPVGTVVKVNFSDMAGPASLKIGGKEALIISKKDYSATAMVMPGAVTTMLASGDNFTVTATPFPNIPTSPKMADTNRYASSDRLTYSLQQGTVVAISADGKTALAASGKSTNSVHTGPGQNVIFYAKAGDTWKESKFMTTSYSNFSYPLKAVINGDGTIALVVFGYEQPYNNSPIVVYGYHKDANGEWAADFQGIAGVFGPAVDVALSADGNTAVTGSSQCSVHGCITHANVYYRVNGEWTGDTAFTNPGVPPNPKYYISTAGSTVVISADGKTIATRLTGGGTSIFINNGAGWALQQTLSTATGNIAISADGNLLLSGARVFARTGTKWAFLQSITPTPNAAAFPSISADASTIMFTGEAGPVVYSRGSGAANWAKQSTNFVTTNAAQALALSADGASGFAGSPQDTTVFPSQKYYDGQTESEGKFPIGAVYGLGTGTPVVTPNGVATSITFINTGATSQAVGWTNGSYAMQAVFIKQGSTGFPTIANGTTYTANKAFGQGSPAGAGWYCVFSGNHVSNTNIEITGLNPSTPYIVAIVGYNGKYGAEKYATAGATGKFTTDDLNIRATNVAFSNTTGTTATLSWTNGSGVGRMVFMLATDFGGGAGPSDMYYSPNTKYGSGNQANGWYCVYNGTGSTVNITGLTNGQRYLAIVYDYNGSIQAPRVIRVAEVSESIASVVTPITPPTGYATGLAFSNTTANSTTLSWVSSNGAARAVFVKMGASGTLNVAQNTTYTANNTFGLGTQAGTNGWYCVYNGTGNTVNLAGLNASTGYRAVVIEYNGTAGTEAYNLSRYNTATVTTTAAPALFLTTNQKHLLMEQDALTDNATPELNIHQGLSPNGDGDNDVFTIDGIGAYPLNTVKVMNSNGDVIYSATGYDNYLKAFDGHSANGTLQKAGTYFYSLEYKKGSETIRKTGYLVIKY